MSSPLPQLTTAEVAARLRVRPATVYAYVSRGQLTATKHGRLSLFDPLEIEQFAARTRPSASEPGVRPGRPLMILDTESTLIEDDNLYFRGRDAIDLARSRGFEGTAIWMWGVREIPAASGPLRAVQQLPEQAPALRRFQIAVATAATVIDDEDPYRVGAMLLDLLPEALGAPRGKTVAARLAELWRAPDAQPALDLALALAIDHDLAVSTLAARIAASARAAPLDCVLAALGAFAGPLHGAASLAAVDLVHAAQRDGGEAALRQAGGAPGFGHRLYSGEDPRATALLQLLRESQPNAPVLGAVTELGEAVQKTTGLFPNVDLALAALVSMFDLPRDAGVTLFALGRTVGWMSHIRAEYDAEPLRLRPHGRYVGP